MTIPLRPHSSEDPGITAVRPRSWRTALTPRLPGKTDAAKPAQALGRIGKLEARLASTKSEIKAVQGLRYDVFYREGGAQPHTRTRLTRRDTDRWDKVCDHLVVIDHDEGREFSGGEKPGGRIVGTYRFLTDAKAAEAGVPFYTSSEFDIAPLIARHSDKNFLELGRSCVLPQWRTKRTVELLWQGCWAYVLKHGIDVMIGCASFEGTDTGKLAEPLSFLFHHAAPPAEWAVRAQPGRAVSMNLADADTLDMKRALHALPPLIKGYLRLGAWFASEAVIDRQFGTTDVLVILPVSQLNPRYVNYYGADASRHAAE